MASPKVTKATSSPVASRQRGHSLAPEHLGEAGAAAALVVAIGGMATLIAAVAMTVGGLTLANGYAGSTAPPHLDRLATMQVAGGIGLIVFGLVVVATTAALLLDLPRSRGLAVGAAAIAAILSAGAAAILFTETRRDLILLIALAVAFVAFAGSAVVLARPRK